MRRVRAAVLPGALSLAAAIGASALLLACRDEPRARPAAPGGVAVARAPCTAVAGDREFLGHVAALAAADRIEGPKVGEGGRKSEVHARYLALVRIASEAQLAALLRCDRPVVRGYVAIHVCAKVPALVPSLEALLADRTEVERMDGCIVIREPLGALVAEELAAHGDRPEARALLARAAADARLPSDVRARALPFAETRDLSLALLDSPDPVLVRAALSAIERDPGARPRVLRLATHPDPKVRFDVATALGDDPTGLETLEALARDPDGSVRRGAAFSYPALERAKGDIVRALLADPYRPVRDAAAEALARRPTDANLELLRGYLGTPDAELPLRVLQRNDQPRVRAFMTRYLGSLRDGYARSRALVYFAEVSEPRALPLLRRSLQARDVEERKAAARAIGFARDAASIPLLREMLEDPDPYAVLAAAAALLAMDAPGARPAIEHAARDCETPWARRELERLIAEGSR